MPFSLLQLLLLFWLSISSAQSVPVSGTVFDAQGTLPGVNVKLKNKTLGTTTDANGTFQIIASPEDTLVFSSIGYVTITTKVGQQTTLKIIMQSDKTTLEEVFVNAGYYKVKDKERTGSIAKITAKEIETQPVTNFLATMQGRMAGVNITQNTGVAGGGFNIQIRGINSLRNEGNAPLYVIDGVPYASDPIGSGSSASIMPALTSPLNNINPADIESIEILKDADATAIYGSRGANGVVLVSTKKGKKGATRYSAKFSQGYAQVGHYMKMLNTQQYVAMRKEAFANDGITEYPESAYDVNGTWDANRYTDWQRELLGGTAKITNINASVSGGSERTQFLLSTNYGSETTVFPGDFGYKKANLHFNTNHESEDGKFRMSLTGSYTVQDNNQPSTDLSIEAWILPPNAPALYDEAGNLNWENNTFENPLRNLNGLSIAETHDLIVNGILSYALLPTLELKSNMGFTDLSHYESSTYPSTIYNPAYGVGSDSSLNFYTNTARQSWIIEPQLHWKPTTGTLKTDVLLGSTFQSQNNRLQGMMASGFTSNSMIYNPVAATTLRVTAFDESEYHYQSVFGRVNLNWEDRYIVNLTGRRDGSSRFGPGKQFAYFGAVGAAWLFSNENGLKDQSVLSFGKLRASYGTTGSDQIGNYQFLNTYTPATTQYQGTVGLQPTRLYNADFGWETNKKMEVAIELGLLKDRIFLTTAWYKNRSSNQLVGVPLPGTTGFATLQANLDATVENKGLEVTLRTENIRTTDFSWTTSFNFSSATNTLKSFPNLEGSTFANKYIVGQPLNIIKVFHATGVDPETGIYTFEDVNGDGIITAPEDQQFVKDLNPSYFGGLQNQLRYKNWQLDFSFQFVKQEQLSIPEAFGLPGAVSNQDVSVLDHWQQPGDKTPKQIYTTGANGVAEAAFYNYTASDAVIKDASYIRLKNVSLRFEFPKSWFGKVGCRASLEGQNLLTFTKFKGMDPEQIGVGQLPPLRVITAGLQFNF
ncbi:SusC/RagA family TonB-linked outer membrane protein [Flavobacterium tegetincola]|uniref:SusC/RagA family TonB-linked outer membrane protein n=1 Tax=Flavobacterium tegetincola TaxID=150172 RepID=UPI00047E3877